MKSQLLEDLHDSHPRAPASSAERTATRSGPAPPSEPRSTTKLRDARVWRERDAQFAPEGEAHGFANGAHGFAKEACDFASPQPDPLLPQPRFTQFWFERWGRRAATWAVGVVGLTAVGSGAFWLYTETKLDDTLALVADHSPAPSVHMPVPSPASAPVAAQPVAPLAGAAASGTSAAPFKGEADASMPAAPLQRTAGAPPSVAPAQQAADDTSETPLPQSAQEQPHVSVAPSLTESPRRAKRNQVSPQPPATAATTRVARAEESSNSTDQFSETLRQCRAAGYHAELCLQRHCVATRHGLSCRG
jgi:hypothetical protein